MIETRRYSPGWAPVHFGEDESPAHRRFTWRHLGFCVFVFIISVYAGLLLAAAWQT